MVPCSLWWPGWQAVDIAGAKGIDLRSAPRVRDTRSRAVLSGTGAFRLPFARPSTPIVCVCRASLMASNKGAKKPSRRYLTMEDEDDVFDNYAAISLTP